MNRHWKKGLLIAALAGGLALTSVPAPAFAATTSENSALDTTDQGTKRSGWFGANGKWFYYDPVTGEKAVGWKKIAGKATTSWYYFNQYGVMQVGWKLIDGKYYHFDTEGRMQTGWQQISGKWYFLKDGVMRTGWVKLGGYYYYFSQKTGAAVTGWVKTGGKWYYLSPSDYSMDTGWKYIDGTRYYFDPKSGAMSVGWKQISQDWYYFNAKGERSNGLKKIGSDMYYFSSSGIMQKDRNIGGMLLGKDGKCKYISCVADSGINVYSVKIYPSGKVEGSWESRFGDTGYEGPTHNYYIHKYTFSATVSAISWYDDYTYSMKVKSYSQTSGVENHYIVDDRDGSQTLVETGKGTNEDLKEEWTVGSTMYLYLPGKQKERIFGYEGYGNYGDWYSLNDDWSYKFENGILQNCIIDNPSVSDFFDMGAGAR